MATACEFCGKPNVKGHHAHCKPFREHINEHRADIVATYHTAGATGVSVAKVWGIAKETVAKFVAAADQQPRLPRATVFAEHRGVPTTSLEAVKGLVRQVDRLEKENSGLKQRIFELEAEVNRLRSARPGLPYWTP